MSVFKEHCVQYLKKNISVIPDKGKVPLIKEWTQFANRLPNVTEVQTWGANYPDAGIAVMLGKQSGIVALDFDSTDPEVIAAIESHLPQSPCAKVGSKGWTRFFKYSSEETMVFFREVVNAEGKVSKEVVLELLSDGKKTTIPPSDHPNGSKYQWIGKPLIEALPELPTLDLGAIQGLMDRLGLLTTSMASYGDSKASEGRTLALTKLVSKIIAQPHLIDDAVQRLLEFDKTHHKTPLFGEDGRDPTTVAAAFYTDHLRSINKKRAAKGLEPQGPVTEAKSETVTTKSDNTPKKPELPIPTGFMGEVYNYMLKSSYVEQPAFALSATIALMATITSQKVSFQGVCPNLYLLNIGQSGSGKDFCQKTIKNLLIAVGRANLIGASSYPSAASITVGMTENPVRLDVIDEASDFLGASTQGRVHYQNGMAEVLCKLWSSADSVYTGSTLASAEGPRKTKINEVFRPHLNMLCSTTPQGLSESFSAQSLRKGLIPRFLFFFGEPRKRAVRKMKTETTPKSIKDKIYQWSAFCPGIPKRVPVGQKADALLDKIHSEFEDIKTDFTTDKDLVPIASRLFEQTLKIALIAACGDDVAPADVVVKEQHVKFGYEVIKYFYSHISEFVCETLYESFRDQKVKRVLKIVKDADGITDKQLISRTKWLTSSERVDIISNLRNSGEIALHRDGDVVKFYKGETND